jgi:tetratricopeptide (TPR) repeat protein
MIEKAIKLRGKADYLILSGYIAVLNGNTQNKIGNSEKAYERYIEASRVDPQERRAIDGIILAYAVKKDFKSVKEQLEMFHDVLSDSYEKYYAKALISLGENNNEEALKYLCDSLEILSARNVSIGGCSKFYWADPYQSIDPPFAFKLISMYFEELKKSLYYLNQILLLPKSSQTF